MYLEPSQWLNYWIAKLFNNQEALAELNALECAKYSWDSLL